jgi:glycosyltransferase involved in cell wall biosynthesis
MYLKSDDSKPATQLNNSFRPLVSIITPSYNQGNFIQRTIESVLNQNYPNIEYWVIDGGSKDNTISILKEYENDPRFHWLSEPDQGQGDAVNKGWQLCKGDILGWLNSDDTYLEGAIKTQVEALISHQEIGLVYGDALFIDDNDKIIGNYHTRPFNRKRFLHVSSIAQPTAFFQRNLLEKAGLLNINLHYALDYEFFLRLMWNTTFLYTGKQVATYRLHQNSKTVDGYNQMLIETIEVVKQVCDENSVALAGTKMKAISDWYWMGAINSLESGNYADVRRYAKDALKSYLIRPRIGIFSLKVFDTVFHTKAFEITVKLIDKITFTLIKNKS